MPYGYLDKIKRANEENRRIFRGVRDKFKENVPEGKIYTNREERKFSEEEVYEARKQIALDIQKEQKRRDRNHFVFIVASIFLIALAIRLLFF